MLYSFLELNREREKKTKQTKNDERGKKKTSLVLERAGV